MSNNYDNWERLVEVVLRREQLRQLALNSSREPSFSSTSSSISGWNTPIRDDRNVQVGSSSSTVNETDWERLLPPGYEDTVSRYVNPVDYATKEGLSSSPILLDGGNTRKVVLKILTMTDDKAKRKAIKAAADAYGVDSIAANVQEQKLTIIGEMDSVVLVKKLKKVGTAKILSVGPANEGKKE